MSSAAPQLRILAHNAFWFQGSDFASDQPPPADAAILDQLGRVYRALNADVLCVQEVQSPAAFDALQQALALPGHYCPGRELPQYGGAVFWRGETRYVGDSRAAGAAPQRMWQRLEAHVVARRVCIANIHLPSNRQLGPAAGAARRLAEIMAVVEGPCRPDVLAGDFNEQPDGGVSRYLVRQGYRDAAVLAGQADQATTIGGGRGDWILVHESLGAIVAEYRVLSRRDISAPAPVGAATPRARSDRFLSDHLPLLASLAWEGLAG